MVAPASKPVNIEEIKPRIRSTAKRQYIRYGPITLPASKVCLSSSYTPRKKQDTINSSKDGGASAGQHSHEGSGSMSGGMSGSSAGGIGLAMDPNGFPFTRTMDGGFCQDCTVLAAKIDIVFENGTRADIANGVYLHHLVAMTTGKTQPSWVSMCPGNSSTSSLATLLGGSIGGGGGFVGGAVDEFVDYFTTPDGKVNSGYYIPAASKAMMSGEVINYLKSQQTVYIRLDLEWVPGKVGTDAIKTPLNVEGLLIRHPFQVCITNLKRM
jgi:hypothetical protein